MLTAEVPAVTRKMVMLEWVLPVLEADAQQVNGARRGARSRPFSI